MRKCLICRSEITGRSDKKFCSVKCKNNYHLNLFKETNEAVYQTDKILHRNRTILFELLGEQKTQVKIKKLVLDTMKFNFKYLTQSNVNSNGKYSYSVYDISWMDLSDDVVLISRKKAD